MSLIRDSLELLQRAADAAREETGEAAVVIALSGGKDSIVTLDLAMQVFSRVEAFYMHLVEGLQCEAERLDPLVRRYGIRLHHVPHFALGGMLKDAVFSPHRHGHAHYLPDIKQKDIEALVRARSGVAWLAFGHRASDSIERNAMLKKIGGFDPKTHRVYPIWRWKPKDVLAYLRAKRLPIPRQLFPGHSDGVNLYPRTLRVLRERYPDDYRKILEVFPYAEAGIAREDFRKRWTDTEPVSEIRGGTVETERNPRRPV